MSGAIPEADWRVFRSLHPIWIDRFCKRVNGELLRALSDDSRDAYQQYLAAYKLMHKRDKEIASAFDDFRRSTAVFQIAIIRKLGSDHRRGTWTVQRVNTRFAPAFLGSVSGIQALKHSRTKNEDRSIII